MSINREEFKTAFREVYSLEFADVPDDENTIDIIPSKRFEKKMERIINTQRKPYYCLINTAAKRVAMIAIAIITLFAASLSVKAIRTPIINFVIEVYETFVEYFFEGDTINIIEKEYTVTHLPEGYVLKEKIVNEARITLTYANNENNLYFTQRITSSAKLNFDNEYTVMRTIDLENLQISISEMTNNNQAFWVIGEYSFDIIYSSDISDDEIIKIIQSVKQADAGH